MTGSVLDRRCQSNDVRTGGDVNDSSQGGDVNDSEGIAIGNISTGDILLLEEGHCLRDHVIAACNRCRGSRVEDTSLTTLLQMVEGGLGVTLLPGITLHAGILRALGWSLAPSRRGRHRARWRWWRGAADPQGYLLEGDEVDACWGPHLLSIMRGAADAVRRRPRCAEA